MVMLADSPDARAQWQKCECNKVWSAVSLEGAPFGGASKRHRAYHNIEVRPVFYHDAVPAPFGVLGWWFGS